MDAADFAVIEGNAPRFDVSDQATLHMEDTAPTRHRDGCRKAPAALATRRTEVDVPDRLDRAADGVRRNWGFICVPPTVLGCRPSLGKLAPPRVI